MNPVPNSEGDYREYAIPRHLTAEYRPIIGNGGRGSSSPSKISEALPSSVPKTNKLASNNELERYAEPKARMPSQNSNVLLKVDKVTRKSSPTRQTLGKLPSKFVSPRPQSQFKEENAQYKDNPFMFRGRTHTAGRLHNKLNRSGFDMEEVKAAFINPGPFFDQTVTLEEQEATLYHVEPFCCAEYVTFANTVSFESCQFEGQTLDMIWNRGLEKMTAIQKYTIPLLMERINYGSNKALIVRSPSGGGKTLAVALPIMSRIFHMKKKYGEIKGPFAVFLAHNNVACAQLCKELLAICPEGGPIRVGMSCGSQDSKVINRLVDEGVDILVCTAGRADNHFFRSAGGTVRELPIDKIRYLVLDEADMFLDFSTFYKHIDPIFKKLREQNGRIKLLFLTSCYKKLAIFKSFLPKEMEVSMVSVGRETLPLTVRLKCFDITGQHKHNALMALLENKSLRDEDGRPPKTLIYVKENDRCAQLAARLKSHGYLAKEIASQDPTNDMLKNMHHFLQGEFDIIVTQDLMARMINVPDLKVVIHYDLCEEHNHHNILSSCGRVGRLGNIGYCFIFYDRREDFVALDVLKKIKHRMIFTNRMDKIIQKWRHIGVDDFSARISSCHYF